MRSLRTKALQDMSITARPVWPAAPGPRPPGRSSVPPLHRRRALQHLARIWRADSFQDFDSTYDLQPFALQHQAGHAVTQLLKAQAGFQRSVGGQGLVDSGNDLLAEFLQIGHRLLTDFVRQIL